MNIIYSLCCMLCGYGMMYQALDRYVENDIDEIEHAFIPDLKWPDSYVLKVNDARFWLELQNLYGICITKADKENIKTVADLKNRIADSLQADCTGNAQ